MDIIHTMVLLSPLGLALVACVGFGLALAARQALGEERGVRVAAERARAAAVKTLSANRDWEMEEVSRFRRLLDCHIETILAEASDFRQRSVPSPGGVLEGLCSWNTDWKRQLAKFAGIGSDEVEMLLKNELPIMPPLARRLELFTGAPARFWERLWQLHTTYRSETDLKVVHLIDAATHAGTDAPRGRPVLQIVDEDLADAPTIAIPWDPSSAAAELPAVLQPSPPAPPPTRREPTSSPPLQRPAVEVHPPVVAYPGIAARGQRGAVPPPRKPPVRIPAAPPGEGPALRRAGTLTDFPVMSGDLSAKGGGWEEAERSPLTLTATMQGIGTRRAP